MLRWRLVLFLPTINQLPGFLSLIVSSSWGVNPVFGGLIGSAISWGVKRGIYSNEAGHGSSAIVSAAAECSYPAKQRLVRAFSVYIDTLIVCTSSAFIILLTGSYSTVAADGETMLANNIPSVEYGIRLAQTALSTAYGGWAGKLLAIIIIMFVFTSLMGYYYQAEANVRYLVKDNKIAVWVIRIVFLVSAFSGVLAELVEKEMERQEHNIEMIASESTAPLAVMELTGSVFTNKTLEGIIVPSVIIRVH